MSDLAGLEPSSAGEADRKSVKIREDPDSKAHLEALFQVVKPGLSPRGSQGGKPMREREFPDSFFAEGRHTLGPAINLPHGNIAPGGGLHAHSVSLPAKMDHRQQLSYDGGMGALPPGWEMGRTDDGTPYYIE